MADILEKLDTLKSCLKVIMALATLAAGLLLIRLFGENRIQCFIGNVLPEKKAQKRGWVQGVCMPAVASDRSAKE